MTNKQIGRLLIITGALLLAAAVSLVVYNRVRSSQASEAAGRTLTKLREVIGAESSADDSSKPDIQPSGDTSSAADSSSLPDEPPAEEALEIDGEFYIGIISIPKLGLELPVARDYSEYNMSIAPSRWKGSLAGRDMIICGHNYAGFFRELDSLKAGDEIAFTDLRGRKQLYSVSYQELIDGWDSEGMAAGSDSWDLTVFTCTWSGRSRVTIRAVLQNDNE